MLPKNQLELLCPFGYRTKLITAEKGQDEEFLVILGMTHDNSNRFPPFVIELRLPGVKDPFIFKDGLERAVLTEITEIGYRGKGEIIRSFLQRSLEMSMADFIERDGPSPNGDAVMHNFMSMVAASNLFIDSSFSSLERVGQGQMVRLSRGRGNPIDPSWREFDKSFWGRLDPSSTSQSSKINRVFRTVEDKEHSLCGSLNRNGIALRLLPRRSFLLRTAIERHLEQVVPEKFLVQNKQNELSGKNLMTALMDLGTTTFEDAIAVSQSAAVALTARRTIVQTWIGHQPLTILVKIGDFIPPRAPIARTLDRVETVQAEKIYYDAQLMEVQATPTTKFGCAAWRYKFVFESQVGVKTGDKISGRHGNKGIAWVIPDHDMPSYQDPKHPDIRPKIDICISPISVVKRRAMSLLYEMMLAKKAIAENTTFELDAWDVPKELDFKKLVSEGWGDKDQLWLMGQKLPEETFIGPLGWIRLDKLAKEQVSAQAGPVMLNHLGIPIDSAKANGQKRDVSKGLAMYHRRLEKLLKWTIAENTLGVRYVENLVKVIEPEFSIREW